jgi:beta-galactosidase
MANENEEGRDKHPCETDPLIQNTLRNGKARRSRSFFIRIVAISFIVLVLAFCKNLSNNRESNVHPTFRSSGANIPGRNKYIRPGHFFYDTEGDPINAHAGGFLRHNNTYYWYGEIKQGKTYLPESNANWGGTRVDLVGFSCYASIDLLNWRKCNNYNVLPAVNDDPSHDLHFSKVAERPKVVYNAKTDMFVMWFHVDTMDYQLAQCGVATSRRPEGPFTYLGSFRPEGQMARDLTVFVDDDSKAYLFTSSEDNAVMHRYELSEDYLTTAGTFERMFIGEYVEAPTIFKRDGKYFFIGSGCTAWLPNSARYAVSESILGPWKLNGNPCKGDDSNTTFHSQSTYVIPVSNGTEELYIFAADRWNMNDLSDSRYVWLPIDTVGKGETIEVWWQDFWALEDYIR